MNLLEKYQIDFIDMSVGFNVLFNMKYHLIKSILMIDLNYYRNIGTYIRLIFSVILIVMLILPIDVIGKIPLMLVLFSLNADLIYIFVHIYPPYVNPYKDETDSIKILLDENKHKFVVLYRDRYLGYLTKINLPALLFIPLLNEYLNNENLPEYKKQFITNNLGFSFEESDNVEQKEFGTQSC